MSALNSAEYYRNRERQERARAAAAVSPAIAAIHLQMADRYSELIEQANSKPRLRLAGPA